MLRLLLALVFATTCCSSQTRIVALTFDDLPIAAGGGPDEARRVNDAILAALAKHHAPAIAFVNEKTVQRIGGDDGRKILRNWLDHGHELGNHTFSHADLDNINVEQFQDEVLQGEASIAELQHGKRPRYLRFPYNHTGDTMQKHNAAAAFLKERGYTVAPCTIDSSDYEFARAYNLMLAKNDKQSAEKLRAEYLEYTAAEIDYYSKLDQSLFGREVPDVMLLHANRLNADLLDQILALFEQRHYRFVDLGAALADAAYRTPETYITKFGPMWGYRWARELGVHVNGRLEAEPPAWVLKYGL